MHCPVCGQQQISDQTRFCSRCGFPLVGVADLIANNGLVPTQKLGFTGQEGSQKRRGIKQGVFLFLMTFLVVPLMIMISIALAIEPFLAVGSLFLFAVGGLLRIVYALMFEPAAGTVPGNQPISLPGTQENRGALPNAHSIPASVYTPPAGIWRDTNDLQRGPGSVTDSTTKLLEKDPPSQ